MKLYLSKVTDPDVTSRKVKIYNDETLQIKMAPGGLIQGLIYRC